MPVEEYNSVEFPVTYRTFVNLYIAPDNNQTRKIANAISSSFFIRNKVFANNIDEMRDKFVNDFQNKSFGFADRVFGIDFANTTNFPFEYTLLIQYNSKLFGDNKISFFSDTRSCRNDSSLFEDCGANTFAYYGLTRLQNDLNNFIRKVKKVFRIFIRLQIKTFSN